MCLDRWSKLMDGNDKPLVITGQAYWGESEFTQTAAEDKLDDFLQGWTNNRVVGINWWHFGGGSAMSHRMLDSITKAALVQSHIARRVARAAPYCGRNGDEIV